MFDNRPILIIDINLRKFALESMHKYKSSDGDVVGLQVLHLEVDNSKDHDVRKVTR